MFFNKKAAIATVAAAAACSADVEGLNLARMTSEYNQMFENLEKIRTLIGKLEQQILAQGSPAPSEPEHGSGEMPFGG